MKKTLAIFVVGGILGLVVGLAATPFINAVSVSVWEQVKLIQSEGKEDCTITGRPCSSIIGLVNPINVTPDDTICNNFKLPALNYTFTYTSPEHTYTIANPAPAPEVHLAVVAYIGPDPMIGYKERNPQNANLVTEIYQKGYASKYISASYPAGVVNADEPVCTRTFVGWDDYDPKFLNLPFGRWNEYDLNLTLRPKALSFPTIVGFSEGKRKVK